MPSKDKYHDVVIKALEKDGWTITNDPLFVKIGRAEMYIDLGAERVLAAQKGNEEIAVEIKSFTHPSFITAFYNAIGQFVMYEEALKIDKPEYTLFLAIPLKQYEREIEDERLFESAIENRNIQLLIYDIENEKIDRWIK